MKYQEALESKITKRKPSKAQRNKFSEYHVKSDEAYCLESNRQFLKRSRIDSDKDDYQNSILEDLDFNDSQSSLHALLRHSNFLKENNQKLLRDIDDDRNQLKDYIPHDEEEYTGRIGNSSARSQLSLTISHQSSNDSDRSYSRSVVIRSQEDHHQRSGLKNSKTLEQ